MQGFAVDTTALRTAATRLGALGARVAPLGAAPVAQATTAVVATPTYLSGTACEAFAGQLEGVLALISEEIIGHETGLNGNAGAYEKAEETAEADFAKIQRAIGA
ncbi:hypothetical protein [Phytomonospora endophytica]|uniref:PE domain-containing protein n=1 Tax=Phytomonospora endophytica TaxID=714109 RepID=A0A841FTN0_9ACTN|nr:hypothetical protein [Phytomonospora endophytica]MBB6039144.1 hypothetical protein [Phytomonospora endophytica]GIG67619.1 hypothetical protein Pen01_39140 [Phytomonospora endophytica]